MKRSTFLAVASFIAMAIGLFALSTPVVLLETAKVAIANGAAVAMTRTVGVLIFCSGILNYMVRNDPDSGTLKSVLVANLLLQVAMMPLDPIAYAVGAFHTLGSFVPNTILHVLLAGGFVFYLSRMRVPHAAFVGSTSKPGA